MLVIIKWYLTARHQSVTLETYCLSTLRWYYSATRLSWYCSATRLNYYCSATRLNFRCHFISCYEHVINCTPLLDFILYGIRHTVYDIWYTVYGIQYTIYGIQTLSACDLWTIKSSKPLHDPNNCLCRGSHEPSTTFLGTEVAHNYSELVHYTNFTFAQNL